MLPQFRKEYYTLNATRERKPVSVHLNIFSSINLILSYLVTFRTTVFQMPLRLFRCGLMTVKQCPLNNFLFILCTLIGQCAEYKEKNVYKT